MRPVYLMTPGGVSFRRAAHLAMRTGLFSLSGLLPRGAVAENSRSTTRCHSMPKMLPTEALPSQLLGLPRMPPTRVVILA